MTKKRQRNPPIAAILVRPCNVVSSSPTTILRPVVSKSLQQDTFAEVSRARPSRARAFHPRMSGRKEPTPPPHSVDHPGQGHTRSLTARRRECFNETRSTTMLFLAAQQHFCDLVDDDSGGTRITRGSGKLGLMKYRQCCRSSLRSGLWQPEEEIGLANDDLHRVWQDIRTLSPFFGHATTDARDGDKCWQWQSTHKFKRSESTWMQVIGRLVYEE